MELDRRTAKEATGEAAPKINKRGEWSAKDSYKRNDSVTFHGWEYDLVALSSLNELPDRNPRVWSRKGKEESGPASVPAAQTAGDGKQ